MPNVLMVPVASPWRSVQQLISLASEGAVPRPGRPLAFGALIAAEISRWREGERAGRVHDMRAWCRGRALGRPLSAEREAALIQAAGAAAGGR